MKRHHPIVQETSKRTKVDTKCLLCGHVSTSTGNAKRHADICGKNLTSDFLCSVDGCGKSFTTIYYLNNHLKRHENRSIQCGECNKMYSNPYSLKSHVKRVHDKVKTIVCTVGSCDEAFHTK